MSDVVLEEVSINRFFEEVNLLESNREIPYEAVDKFMGWDNLDPDDSCDRARLNELRNQLKARINAIARKGITTDSKEFNPFQLIVSAPGVKWRKIADSGYANDVIAKGSRKVVSAISNMQDRTLWAKDKFVDDSDQRFLLNHFIAQLEIQKKRLKEEYALTTSTLRELNSRQSRLGFDETNRLEAA